MKANTFNIMDFCEKNITQLRYNLTTPWKNGDKVYATDRNILFIGKSSDYLEIQLDDNQKPNIEALGIDNINNYVQTTAAEIEEILISHPPKIDTIHETLKCEECQGEGFKEEQCGECGHLYEKKCSNCQGEGTLKTSNIIGREIAQSTTPFKNTLLDWKYLELIKNSMEALGGEWQLSVREPLDMIVFKNEAAIIVVMPMLRSSRN